MKNGSGSPHWEKVSPAKAMKFLETMGDSNRFVRQTHIDFLAGQMRQGLWRKIPDPIMFDKTGRMVDGQHRCWAIVESNCEVSLLVALNVDPADVPVIDTGLSRDHEDTAHYQGWGERRGAATVAKILGTGGVQTRIKYPADVLHNWYEFYQPSIDFAISLYQNSRPGTGKTPPLMLAAAIARAHASGVDPEVLTRFMAVIKTGLLEHEADRAAFSLRDAWMQARLGRGMEQYYKSESAIRAFVDRRPIRKIQPPEGEVFPIKPLPMALRYKVVNSAESPRSGAKARGKLRAKVAEKAV